VAFALKAAFDPSGTGEAASTYELRVDGESYAVTIDPEGLTVARGEHPRADARIETDGATLYKLGNGELDLRAAIAAGTFRFDGDRSARRSWGRAFTVVPAAVGLAAGV
jgi:putative sterol carrier protein